MTDGSAERARRPTIKDVARAAGVSTALVSIVFRDAPGASSKTRQRVKQVAEELGYRPDAHARLLRRSRAHLLGVAFLVESAFHGDLLPDIYLAAEQAGYEVALSGWAESRSEERAVRSLLEFRCDALILLGTELGESRLAELAGQASIVVQSRRLRSPVVDSVRTDDEIGMRMAVEHLAGLGHRAIAHIDGGDNVKGIDRMHAYLAAMDQLGLGDQMRVIRGGQTVDAGAEAGLRYRGGHTALLAFNDDCARGLMTTLQARGVSVPGDVSVMGFDGSRLSRISSIAGITTIRQDAPAMARLAVEQAVIRAEGDHGPMRDVVLPPTLVVGSSTASPTGTQPEGLQRRIRS